MITLLMRFLAKLIAVATLLVVPVVLPAQSAVDSDAGVRASASSPARTTGSPTTSRSSATSRKSMRRATGCMLVEAGKSTQGRTYTFALVSSAENLRQVDHYREIARRLAHPEGLTDAEARRLAHEGKAFVHIDGGLHSSEVAGPQHVPQLLYDLVSRADEPEMKAMLDNVILMLWPTINPGRPVDGRRLLHGARRDAERKPGHEPAAALSGIRRPRQQPRRLHAEHDRIARDGAHVAAVGAEHHLRAAPVVAVPDAHLAAAVRRTDRRARAGPGVRAN